MPRVLCTRPGASESIGGVRFAPTDRGMLSDPISLELAQELFLECPGFRLIPDAAPAPAPEPAPEPEKRGPGRPRKEEPNA